jgi:uncharacterized membrane protein
VAKVDSTIEVEVPVQTAYNQWTQFEEFPRFMEGVREVRQLDDERLYWSAEIGGEMKEWYAVITRQVPDEVVAWESEGGARNDGTVVFKPIDAQHTEIELHINFEPEGMKEEVGSALGAVSRRVQGDLNRFKEFVETRGAETGAWRGEISHGQTQAPGSGTGSTGMDTAPRPPEGTQGRPGYGSTGGLNDDQTQLGRSEDGAPGSGSSPA